MRDQFRAMAPVLLAATAVGAFLGHRSLADDQLRVREADAGDPQATQPGNGESAQANEVSPRAGHREFIQTFLIRIGGDDLKPGDEEQMAKYDVVFANKWHYDDIKGNTWKAIKAINPDTQIYLYVAAKSTVERDDAKPAMHLTNLGRYHNARGHSMGSLYGENPDLFLRDRAGERIMTTYANSFCVLDFGNPRFHAYAIEALAADFVGKPWTADGIFSDSLSAVKANVNAWPAAYDTDAKWAAAMNSMVGALSGGLHAAGQKFAANREFTCREDGCRAWLALDQSPTAPDFVMEEGGFVLSWGPETYATQFRSENQWKRQVDLLGQIQHSKVGYANHTRLARGESGLDNHGRTHTYWDALWFALASFLVGKNDEANNSYFFFFGKSGYNLACCYHDEYDRIDLGRATSEYRVATHDRVNVYWREFEKGYVYVNPSPHAPAGFFLPEPCKRLSHGNINEDPRTLADVLKIDLGALRGAVLVKTSALATP